MNVSDEPLAQAHDLDAKLARHDRRFDDARWHEELAKALRAGNGHLLHAQALRGLHDPPRVDSAREHHEWLKEFDRLNRS